MIRLISGVYGAEDGLKRPKDGPFSLTDNEEARLVKRGVAEYIYSQTSRPTQPASGGDIDPLRYDVGMTMKQLQGIAAYFGLDASKLRSKQAVVDMLDAHLARSDDPEENSDPDNEDGEEETGEEETDEVDPEAPDLGAAEPTV